MSGAKAVPSLEISSGGTGRLFVRVSRVCVEAREGASNRAAPAAGGARGGEGRGTTPGAES
jgi:hypothetical protein